VLRFDEQGRSDPDKAREGVSSKGHRQVEVEDVFFLISELSQMKNLRDAHVFGPDVLGKGRRRLLEALRETMHPLFTPWWSRICVVQEVAVATRVKIIYGGVSAPWSMITSAASKYIEHSSACCAQYTARLPRDEVKVLVDYCNRILDVEGSRSRRVHVYEGALHVVDSGTSTLLSLCYENFVTEKPRIRGTRFTHFLDSSGRRNRGFP
jgi:hypothetical protein